MNDMSLSELLAATNAPLTDPQMNRSIGDGQPRFELYHFALSVCSQKVRTCLAEKAVPHLAHDINLQMPLLGNYDPAYVRLRISGGKGLPLVGGYTGRSSTQTEGFDPAVVPTLVDLVEQRVYVDSAAICEHIDRVWDNGARLMPPQLEKTIRDEIAIVDATPHVALLYGPHPDGDFRPERIRKVMPGVHDRKIDKIRKARSMVKDDPALSAAYDAKIRKEEAARSFVATPEKMRQAVSETLAIVSALDQRLDDGRNWICGEIFTMADIFWAISLFRLKWLGMAFCWQGGHTLNDHPHANAAAYAERLFERQSTRDAVIHWPGIPRTEYVIEYYAD